MTPLTARKAIKALAFIVEHGHPDGSEYQQIDVPLVIDGRPWHGEANIGLDGENVAFSVEITARKALP
jgi:hypothetical protein